MNIGVRKEQSFYGACTGGVTVIGAERWNLRDEFEFKTNPVPFRTDIIEKVMNPSLLYQSID